MVVPDEKNNDVELSTLNPGDVFENGIGKFIVLEQGTTGTAVISQELMRKGVRFDDGSPDYKTSSLRKLMNGEILDELEEVFGAGNIIEHEVDLTTVDMQPDFGTCECKVRPITFDEARKYNDLLVNKEIGGWWWTCTPWSTEERGWKYSVAVVAPSGGIDHYSCDSNCGVRPFCILKSNIFVSKEY